MGIDKVFFPFFEITSDTISRNSVDIKTGCSKVKSLEFLLFFILFALTGHKSQYQC